MRKRLALCLISLGVLSAGQALAESWQPTPGEPKTLYDKDFLRVDTTSGLVVLRVAEGKGVGSYKDWPAGKSPIMLYAIDCAGDKWLNLGMDYKGDQGLPKGWRNEEKIDDYKAAIGPAGKLACEQRESLPKVALP
jgi:hypothetical protein